MCSNLRKFLKLFSRFLFRNFQKLFILNLFCVFQFAGCYSYKTISNEDYLQEKEHSSIKIILKTGEEIIVEKPTDLMILPDEKKIIIKNDTTEKVIFFEHIAKMKESKFDYLSSCISGVAITVAVILALLTINILVILLKYGRLSVG